MNQIVLTFLLGYFLKHLSLFNVGAEQESHNETKITLMK